MKIYWPESLGKACSYVGYNHAVGILRKAFGEMVTANKNEADIRLYCNIPFHHNPKELRIPGKPLVIYTMFESTKLPNSWVKFLNKHVDAILVPSEFNVKVFMASGVKKPIKVVPLGIDKDEFSYIPIAKHEGFNLLWQGHNYDPNGRKGAKIAEQAFRELRESKFLPENAKLYLKYRPHESFKIEIDNLEAEPGIIHISSTLSREKMAELYSKIDCCVNTSRGEGFGFIPLEQAVIGRPVLLTDWSYPFNDSLPFMKIPCALKKSPVVWFYKHITFSAHYLEWNFGKGLRQIKLPDLMKRVSNGAIEFGPGLKQTFVPKTLRGTIHNFIAGLHEWSGLYWKATRTKKHTILFERRGCDAEVNIDELKVGILVAYESKEFLQKEAAEMSEKVADTWSLKRIRTKMEVALKELQNENIIRRSHAGV